MGKYMTKCSRGVGELAVMEVTQVVGVRTRARALAAASAPAPATPGPKRRKSAAPPPDVLQTSSYLQLRNRRLVMTSRRERSQPANSSAASGPRPAAEGVSRCSSNASSEVVVDVQESEGFESSTCNFESKRARRETTPSSEVRSEAGDLESAAGARSSSRTAEATPTTEAEMEEFFATAEMEEFFATAEREQAQRFAAKYNYDVVNDVPLDGRFDWVLTKL